MQVTSFVFDQNSKVASWSDGSKKVAIQQLRQACRDAKHGVIVGLPVSTGMTELNFYDYSGALIAQLTSPDGYQFEYLVEDATYGVRAVCSGVSAAGDTLDWYFKIDLPSGKLIKQGRAY